jgi:NADH dehydrogenase
MSITNASNNTLNIPVIDLPRVVIIGGGFAGLKLARNINSAHIQTVLLDQNNYHTFQPLLYQVATAGLEPDSIAYPLRKTLKKKKRTHIRMTKVEHIDLIKKAVVTSIGEIRYDYLVIATGAKTNYFGNANIEKYAMPMKSLTESLDLRSLILQNFEQALTQNSEEEKDSFMNFMIVGGGPTGVELAGALAELKNHVLPKDYPDLDIRRMQIHLIEAGPKVLGAMSEKSSVNALNYLRKIGVNVWPDTLVKDYDGNTVMTNKEVFSSKTLIWAAGVTGNIPNGIEKEQVDRGRIVIDEYARVKGLENVYALGDVAVMKDEHYPQGLPMLGSVAQQQGEYLAKSIKAQHKGKNIKPFQYANKGTMATVGRNLAVVDIGKIHFGGVFAW